MILKHARRQGYKKNWNEMHQAIGKKIQRASSNNILMGECELCGAVKVGVRRVQTGKTEVSACSRCVDKMNLAPKGEAPGLQRARTFNTSAPPRRKNDIMSRSVKELAEDFNKRISSARSSLGWSQQQLAKKMAETVNVVKHAESGKRPTDAVIRKFETVLNITLMVEREASETRFVNSGSSRGMTFGDYLNDLG
jgi:putative transcription factor